MSCPACPRALNGWFRGCVTAAVTLAALPVVGAILSLPYRGFESLSVLVPFLLFFLPVTLILVCLLSAIPAALVIMFAEAFRIRSVLFYVPAGTAIGAFNWRITVGAIHPLGLLFALAGTLAGFAYWFVAGRYAGDDGRRLCASRPHSETSPPPHVALRAWRDR
jgi:hypothetical protein